MLYFECTKVRSIGISTGFAPSATSGFKSNSPRRTATLKTAKRFGSQRPATHYERTVGKTSMSHRHASFSYSLALARSCLRQCAAVTTWLSVISAPPHHHDNGSFLRSPSPFTYWYPRAAIQGQDPENPRKLSKNEIRR